MQRIAALSCALIACALSAAAPAQAADSLAAYVERHLRANAFPEVRPDAMVTFFVGDQELVLSGADAAAMLEEQKATIDEYDISDFRIDSVYEGQLTGYVAYEAAFAMTMGKTRMNGVIRTEELYQRRDDGWELVASFSRQ